MSATTQGNDRPTPSSIDASTLESARRAMFSAASRVLSYHAALLDENFARFARVPADDYLASGAASAQGH